MQGFATKASVVNLYDTVNAEFAIVSDIPFYNFHAWHVRSTKLTNMDQS